MSKYRAQHRIILKGVFPEDRHTASESGPGYFQPVFLLHPSVRLDDRAAEAILLEHLFPDPEDGAHMRIVLHNRNLVKRRFPSGLYIPSRHVLFNDIVSMKEAFEFERLHHETANLPRSWSGLRDWLVIPLP